MDQTDDNDQHIVRLKSAIDLENLMSGGGTTFEIDLNDIQENQETNTPDKYDLAKYSNLDCLGIEDEDTYNDEPFAQIEAKMENLLPDGKIKKRILRQGIGEVLPDKCIVTCDYNAFLEYDPEPFDSTYAFHRSFRFQLGAGNVLPGLELAVKSMKINEKSQFLIHPDYAYGQMGCLDRIPKNATVLFEIEVKNSVNAGAAENEDNENENAFEKVYERAEAMRLKGNDFYKRNLDKQAIKQYNTAIAKLTNCPLSDYSDQEKQQELLLKLYTNLVIVYTKKQLARKACTAANDIHYLVKGTSLKIPVKVHFNNARALMMLGNLTEAEAKLKTAHRLEPHNAEIANEFVKLEKLKAEHYEREKLISKALISNKNDKAEITEEFKNQIEDTLSALIADRDWLQYKLSDDMTPEEVEYVRKIAVNKNLRFRKDGNHSYVYKPDSNK